MTTEWIRNVQGIVIAKIQTESDGNKRIFDAYGKLLGKYNKAGNMTTDAYGRIIARGECLTMLIGR